MISERRGHIEVEDVGANLIMPIPEDIYEGIDRILEIPKTERERLLKAINAVTGRIEIMLVASEYTLAFADRVELLYLLGYTYYLHPDRINDVSIYEKVENSLCLAIHIQPHHSFSWLYLGHNAYDLGKYHEASKRFAKCKEEDFIDFIRLKLLEMQLCCQIKSEGIIKMIPHVEKFVTLLENHSDPIDVFPQELTRILEEGYDKILEEIEKEKLSNMLARLSKVGYLTPGFGE